ncbi:M3 family metallopeptidase [Azospirillum soli]|uniref:M3 family metallopeptidase n=1 Tax=Azospirillum soli TaxID=1304799 RepID=UPI001AE4F785|nr:M3 family metallopeptidase [Azospirillum soli]MBP2315677.1 peptidyl-dipeptidase Dcp [Azospirillum soli]
MTDHSSDNPFFEAWTTPFGLPPFDRIRPEHFPPAFNTAMAENVTEIEAITGNPEAPTFANTIEAMERAGRALDRVGNVFFNLNSSHSSDELEAIALDYAPKFAQHSMRIALNPALFARVADLYARRDTLGLAPDQLRLLERHHLGFVRSGALLAPEQKARMSEITERLATLHTLFGQNVLHDEKDWQLILEDSDLAGLPDFARSAAAQAARERGLEGKYVITLARSSVEPFLTFSARRDLRRIAYEAWTKRGEHEGEHDNRPLIQEIVRLRAEQARLLGYKTFADFKLDDSMAKQTSAVERLLLQVWEPAKRKAAAERAELQEAARAEGMNEAIAPWDWRYYAEKVRQAKYDLDEAEVKPYFVLDNMVRAAFDSASRLFGISFTERPDLPVYHPDVRVYEVTEKDGGRHVGLFLHDNFARSSKRSGAWMSSYRDQESFDGEVSPIIVNNNNFAKGEPTLLSFDDAETLFHEFGHALHGLLSRVRYPSQSGTSVRRDFVEFPSQVYEHWMSAPETLRTYARHHRTSEPIPEDLLRRLLAARNFNQGFGTVEYTAAALLDLEFHTLPVPEGAGPEGLDVGAFERRVLDKIGMPEEIAVRHRPTHFQHLFAGNGYAAGYYAYLWAEVLDADGFEAFAEAGDLYHPDLAARLKDIYSAGDTRDPMELYTAFRGREPGIQALLKHRGLVDA